MGARARLWTATIIAGLAGGYAFAWDEPTPGPTMHSSPEAADQGPTVQIARRVVEAAGAFDRYVRSASSVSPEFEGANAVSGALMTSAAYDSRQVSEGAVAYAALVALQQPAFVDALLNAAADPSQRAATVERLTATPELVLDLPGATQAAAMVSSALNDMGASLVSRGRAVKQAAYTVQRQPWALEAVAQPTERLAQVEAAGAKQARLSDAETREMLASVVARRQGPEDGVTAPPPTPMVLRGLVLAAASVLGQAGDNQADALTPLLGEPEIATCLKRAKLNLHQCVAAAGPQYEDVFCTGEHAMVETGQCIVKAAGGSMSDGVRVPVARAALAQPAAQSVSVSVPVARSVRTSSPAPAEAAEPRDIVVEDADDPD